MGREEGKPWDCLEGKVVLVTGASSGIGRDLCVDLAKAGCNVVSAARRTDLLQALCDEIAGLASSGTGGRCGRVASVQLDVSQEYTAVDAAVGAAWSLFGRIDALVNNAGVRGTISDPLDLSEDEWNQTVNTNLRGTWFVSKSLCRLMHDAKQKGSITNISSIGGLHNRGTLPGAPAYGVSKAAIDALTKTMALEIGSHTIRVNSISPGLFKSEITSALLEKDWLNVVAERINPLRTFGTLDPALTSLVRYLIHDSSEYVTGNVFIVDAGASLAGVPIYSSL